MGVVLESGLPQWSSVVSLRLGSLVQILLKQAHARAFGQSLLFLGMGSHT